MRGGETRIVTFEKKFLMEMWEFSMMIGIGGKDCLNGYSKILGGRFYFRRDLWKFEPSRKQEFYVIWIVRAIES